MLVLKRKLGEKIMICNDIVVTVIGVQGGRVKLGFDCPGHIPVHREEVHRRIRAERAGAIPNRQRSESPFLPEFA